MRKKLLFPLLLTFLLIFFVNLLTLPIKASADNNGHFLVDFGISTNETSITGWNNIDDIHNGIDTTSYFPLVDDTGATSNATLHLTAGFNSSGCLGNNAGTTSSSLYPASATQDDLLLSKATWCGVAPDTSAAFVLGGLTQYANYNIRFYASRVNHDGVNRTTDYTIGGTTVSLNATDNVNGHADINSVVPSNGAINVAVSIDAASAQFGYLGVLEVTGNNHVPSANAGTNQTITLPTHSVTLSGSGTDPDGDSINYNWAELTNGGATIVSPNSASTAVTDLAAGTYNFQLTVTDTGGASSTNNVNITVNNSVASCAKKIVVLGSSTAAGTGANPISHSWVNLYTTYLQQLNAKSSVINLAVGGYDTYYELPTGTTPLNGRPSPDTAHNITAAIANHPDGIILNLPSNDEANGYSVSETEANFNTIATAAAQAKIPIWFTTTQPRNLSQQGLSDLATVKSWIQSTYPTTSIDFWTTVANNDGTINSTYSYGDGIHVNNFGHQKFYNRVAGSGFIEQLCPLPKPTPTATATTTPSVSTSSTVTPTTQSNLLTGSLQNVGSVTVTSGISTYYLGYNTPTFKGTGTPGMTITVTIHSNPIILTTTVGTDGTWSVIAPAIPNGLHDLLITEADSKGDTTTLAHYSLGINYGSLPATGDNLTIPLTMGTFIILLTSIFLFIYGYKTKRNNDK